MSQAFGVQVVSTPDIEIRHLLPGDQLLILGCDGIWDVLTNQDAVDIALEYPGNPKQASIWLHHFSVFFGTVPISLLLQRSRDLALSSVYLACRLHKLYFPPCSHFTTACFSLGRIGDMSSCS